MSFDEWCKTRDYDFDPEKWAGHYISDYFKALARAHTEYIEWRLDNAGI